MSFFGLETVANDQKPIEYDFQETYDGLADELQEDNDDLNDETFGDVSVGKDFDFAGQTAQVADAIDEEQFAFARTAGRRQGPPEHQNVPNIPSLQPIASLWGDSSSQQSRPTPLPVRQEAAPKVLSLEEVEAQMLAQSRLRAQQSQGSSYPGIPPHQAQQIPQYPFGVPQPQYIPGPGGVPIPGLNIPPLPQGQLPPGVSAVQFPPAQFPGQFAGQFPPGQFLPDQSVGLPSSKPLDKPLPDSAAPVSAPTDAAVAIPYTIPDAANIVKPVPSLSKVMDEDLAQNAKENERLLRRSQKIAQLARYNNLMSAWDKNFITRIQLQQMVTEDPYNEDFYYQVHSAIQARNNPQQPLNAFAKTYLFQRGQRGGRFRRYENPLMRMQQQVRQAVAAAKEHPKKEQVVLEGALGKISMGSGKHPRQTLNLKAGRPSAASEGYNVKSLLKSLEDVYSTLLELESLERSNQDDAPNDEAKALLVNKIWDQLQVTAPESDQHPFIAMLSHDKGKKLIPRILRHLSDTQRLTILTRVFANINSLDVVARGVYVQGADLKARDRESVELFSQTVLPPLVHVISESSYDVVGGLLEILLQSANLVILVSTKVGLAFLTVLISRAELISQEGGVDPTTQANWQHTFDGLFQAVRGYLGSIFPPRNVDDSYVWHFLASLALAAQLEHQRIIVDEVREKIFATMAEAKSLPSELGNQKIANLNLFLNVMGLNATTTEIGELAS